MALTVDAAGSTPERDVIRQAWSVANPRRLKLFAWNVGDAETEETARSYEVMGMTQIAQS